MQEQRIILASGCFWCTEAVFKRVKGVTKVQSGYAKGVEADATESAKTDAKALADEEVAEGDLNAPTYEDVSTGESGYAEAVEVWFEASEIGLEEILLIFFKTHDPTTLNRQGNDVGPQYASKIFYFDEAQKHTAEKMIARLDAEKIWPDKIVTQVEKFAEFYPAEDYHNDYYDRNPNQPYCTFVIDPKIAKLEKEFAGKLK